MSRSSFTEAQPDLALNRRQAAMSIAALTISAQTVGAQTGDTAPASAITTELITYSSRGRSIRAGVYRPTRDPRGSGVVYMHGSGSIGPRQLRYARTFAENGYVAIVPTYLDAAADDLVRGAAVMNAWRACASDAVDWLISDGVDPPNTALTGYSLGSFIAVDGALGNCRAGAAIGVAGGWDVYPPRPPARRIPTLIIRAERDSHVRPQGTEQWRQFLVDRDVPVRMQIIRGAGHIMSLSEWDQVSAASLRFLEGNAGGRRKQS
ncbi:MAG TPA: dienelactone hydrolase family protein [Brevundimonas sp.]|nr:dienelactone hydrolase family protein [Brevundimonas sp.]